MSGDGSDPRLLQALDLLRSVLAEAPGGALGGNGHAAHPPYAGAPSPAPAADPGPWAAHWPEEDDPWLVSSTDLLMPFAPAGLTAGAAAWDAYFGPGPRSGPRSAAAAHPLAGSAAGPAANGAPDIQVPADAFLAPPVLAEEALDDEDAEAVIECLYGFVYAVGRLDVDAAMAWVAEDYHAVDGDQEVDRLGLRHRLEALADELRGAAVEAALAEPPDPYPYLDGLVLVPATLQLDARPPAGPPVSRLLEHVAVLERTADGWRLAALAPRRPRPGDPLPRDPLASDPLASDPPASDPLPNDAAGGETPPAPGAGAP